MSTVPAAPPATRRIRGILLLLLAAATVFGATRLAFLCDDAYITFRYVSNAVEGHGLVWNREPFLPVEGYSCFLWALLLQATWSWTGVEPPDAANVLSIGFGLVQFALVAGAAFRLRTRDGARAGDVLAFCTLAVVVGNRTFLQWMTSGLETALFHAALIGWVLLAFRSAAERGTRWLVAWSALAATAALTRPDGLLLTAATTAAAAMTLLRRERGLGGLLLGLAPLLAVVAHVLWRRAFYGEWLPNTYWAKVGTPWPEAGLRYLFCFVVEHGTWVALPILFAWLVAECRRGVAGAVQALTANLPAVAAVATLVTALWYYVLRVGGDHFEYRVLSHLVPLSTLAVAAMALRITTSRWVPLASVLALGAASTFGWFHLALTTTHPAPRYAPMAPRMPAWTHPLVRVYDRHQAWLQTQFVCLRCSQHAMVLASMFRGLPARQRLPNDPADLMVHDVASAGYIAWSLPDVAILDGHGLNDWVTARWPLHERQALFPAAAALGPVRSADRDGDGRVVRTELEDAFGLRGDPDPDHKWGIDQLLILFAKEDPDALLRDEVDAFADFCDHVRFMAHERTAPREYRDAFAPNVTIEGPLGARVPVVTPRPVPLTPDRVRAIEQEWRTRVRAAMSR